MWIVELFKGLPKEAALLIAAATPVIEVRGSVPLGFLLGLPPLKIFALSVIGSFVPAMPLFWFLNFATKRLRKYPACDRFFEWLFSRTRARSALIERYETIGLTLFVAVPLPGTGVWTGIVAAYLFGLSWTEMTAASLLGTTLAALALTLAGLGITGLF